MATGGAVRGYTYGTSAVSRSPVSLAELRDLEFAIGIDQDDERALLALWDVLAERREALFETFMGRVAHFFLPTFAGADGRPLESYLEAAHPRFLRWIEDTCTRPRDRAWLDYQHEIGLRHHRTKKNRTDGAVSVVEEVPLRYLIASLVPLTAAMGPFLVAAGVSEKRADRLAGAWTRSLVLQVALWSRPYADESW